MPTRKTYEKVCSTKGCGEALETIVYIQGTVRTPGRKGDAVARRAGWVINEVTQEEGEKEPTPKDWCPTCVAARVSEQAFLLHAVAVLARRAS